MIIYDSNLKSFVLNGKNYSYCFYVNDFGMLQHLYYGKKIEKEDIFFLIKEHGKTFEPNVNDINLDMATNRMPTECGSFARGDYHSATIIVKRDDGSAMSRFRYVKHSIINKAIPIKTMPCIRKASQTLTITLKDDFSNTEIDLNYSVLNDSDVLVRNTIIRNIKEGSLDLIRAFSFCTQLPDNGGVYSALRLSGTWASERNIVTTQLKEGTLRIESNRGYSSHQMNPFLAILCDDCSEDRGECFGFNLLYSGSFALTAEMSSYKNVRVQGGINDYLFGWRLNCKEEFVTPQVAICYSNKGIGGMSREYHDFFREHIIDPSRVYMKRPIVVNNWEATFFNFNNEKLFSLIDEASKLGIDTFVLDDGWFGKRNDDKSGLGDWFVNEKKVNGGLKTIINKCKENNLKFGLWIEPEMISEDSDLYRSHPDWAIKKDDVVPCRSRNQLVLDFTRKEVVDYIFEVISKLLREYEISYVKWDKNRDITENYSSNLPSDRQGEFFHRYTLGFYNLAERLTKAFPNVFFEGCAGGGGRFDGGSIYYFSQIWTSDNTDGFERTKIQWGTSICYPLSTMSCHVSDCPNQQTQRTTPFSTRGAIASLGATGYELDLAKLSNEEKSQIKEQIANYKKIDDLILKGDLYRLSNPFETNHFCEMIVSKDKNKAYVVGECFREYPFDNDEILKLKGLDENKVYKIEELNITASGKALMNVGIMYPRIHDYCSWIWHLETK